MSLETVEFLKNKKMEKTLTIPTMKDLVTESSESLKINNLLDYKTNDYKIKKPLCKVAI